MVECVVQNLRSQLEIKLAVCFPEIEKMFEVAVAFTAAAEDQESHHCCSSESADRSKDGTSRP